MRLIYLPLFSSEGPFQQHHPHISAVLRKFASLTLPLSLFYVLLECLRCLQNYLGGDKKFQTQDLRPTCARNHYRCSCRQWRYEVMGQRAPLHAMLCCRLIKLNVPVEYDDDVITELL